MMVIKVKTDPKDQDSKADQIGDERRMAGQPCVEDGESTGTSSPHSNDKAIIKRRMAQK